MVHLSFITLFLGVLIIFCGLLESLNLFHGENAYQLNGCLEYDDTSDYVKISTQGSVLYSTVDNSLMDSFSAWRVLGRIGRKKSLNDSKMAVIFLPGHRGSKNQANCLSNQLLLEAESYIIPVFSINFNEESSGFSHELINAEAIYTNLVISTLVGTGFEQFVIVAHSMGALVAHLLPFQRNYVDNVVVSIISLSGPLVSHPFQLDRGFSDLYSFMNEAYSQVDELEPDKSVIKDRLNTISSVSIHGGTLDRVIRADLTLTPSRPYHHFTSTSSVDVPGVWTMIDHDGVVNCGQLVQAISNAIGKVHAMLISEHLNRGDYLDLYNPYDRAHTVSAILREFLTSSNTFKFFSDTSSVMDGSIESGEHGFSYIHDFRDLLSLEPPYCVSVPEGTSSAVLITRERFPVQYYKFSVLSSANVSVEKSLLFSREAAIQLPDWILRTHRHIHNHWSRVDKIGLVVDSSSSHESTFQEGDPIAPRQVHIVESPWVLGTLFSLPLRFLLFLFETSVSLLETMKNSVSSHRERFPSLVELAVSRFADLNIPTDFRISRDPKSWEPVPERRISDHFHDFQPSVAALSMGSLFIHQLDIGEVSRSKGGQDKICVYGLPGNNSTVNSSDLDSVKIRARETTMVSLLVFSNYSLGKHGKKSIFPGAIARHPIKSFGAQNDIVHGRDVIENRGLSRDMGVGGIYMPAGKTILHLPIEPPLSVYSTYRLNILPICLSSASKKRNNFPLSTSDGLGTGKKSIKPGLDRVQDTAEYPVLPLYAPVVTYSQSSELCDYVTSLDYNPSVLRMLQRNQPIDYNQSAFTPSGLSSLLSQVLYDRYDPIIQLSSASEVPSSPNNRSYPSGWKLNEQWVRRILSFCERQILIPRPSLALAVPPLEQIGGSDFFQYFLRTEVLPPNSIFSLAAAARAGQSRSLLSMLSEEMEIFVPFPSPPRPSTSEDNGQSHLKADNIFEFGGRDPRDVIRLDPKPLRQLLEVSVEFSILVDPHCEHYLYLSEDLSSVPGQFILHNIEAIFASMLATIMFVLGIQSRQRFFGTVPLEKQLQQRLAAGSSSEYILYRAWLGPRSSPMPAIFREFRIFFLCSPFFVALLVMGIRGAGAALGSEVLAAHIIGSAVVVVLATVLPIFWKCLTIVCSRRCQENLLHGVGLLPSSDHRPSPTCRSPTALRNPQARNHGQTISNSNQYLPDKQLQENENQDIEGDMLAISMRMGAATMRRFGSAMDSYASNAVPIVGPSRNRNSIGNIVVGNVGSLSEEDVTGAPHDYAMLNVHAAAVLDAVQKDLVDPLNHDLEGVQGKQGETFSPTNGGRRKHSSSQFSLSIQSPTHLFSPNNIQQHQESASQPASRHFFVEKSFDNNQKNPHLGQELTSLHSQVLQPVLGGGHRKPIAIPVTPRFLSISELSEQEYEQDLDSELDFNEVKMRSDVGIIQDLRLDSKEFGVNASPPSSPTMMGYGMLEQMRDSPSGSEKGADAFFSDAYQPSVSKFEKASIFNSSLLDHGQMLPSSSSGKVEEYLSLFATNNTRRRNVHGSDTFQHEDEQAFDETDESHLIACLKQLDNIPKSSSSISFIKTYKNQLLYCLSASSFNDRPVLSLFSSRTLEKLEASYSLLYPNVVSFLWSLFSAFLLVMFHLFCLFSISYSTPIPRQILYSGTIYVKNCILRRNVKLVTTSSPLSNGTVPKSTSPSSADNPNDFGTPKMLQLQTKSEIVSSLRDRRQQIIRNLTVILTFILVLPLRNGLLSVHRICNPLMDRVTSKLWRYELVFSVLHLLFLLRLCLTPWILFGWLLVLATYRAAQQSISQNNPILHSNLAYLGLYGLFFVTRVPQSIFSFVLLLKGTWTSYYQDFFILLPILFHLFIMSRNVHLSGDYIKRDMMTGEGALWARSWQKLESLTFVILTRILSSFPTIIFRFLHYLRAYTDILVFVSSYVLLVVCTPSLFLSIFPISFVSILALSEKSSIFIRACSISFN